MAKKYLYLEQRLSIVRKALNHKSLKFQEQLPKDLQNEFRQYVMDMMAILDGFNEEGSVLKRLEDD